MLFKNKKVTERFTYDANQKEPIIKASICNGEQVAGFRDIHTGVFEEIMCIRNDGDLRVFKEKYGITGEIKKVY